MKKFKKGDSVKVVNVDLLKGNDKKPELILGSKHNIEEIIEDSKGFQHIDVGLKSKLNYIRSFETKEELKDGDKIHWCHPSRFELI